MFAILRCNARKTFVFTILVLIIVSGCRFYFDTTKDQYTVTKTSHSLENGRNIAFNVCVPCHYNHELNKLVGMPLNDLPKIGGRLVSANLTHSTSNGIPPHYTDAELFYLFKTGISKNGKFMPYMMRPMMADEDVNDLITFLRSDDPALAAADTTVGKTHINLIGRIGIRTLVSPKPYKKGVTGPDKNDPVAYGRYLVAIMSCYHCHSTKAKKIDFADAEKTKFYLQGGMKLKDPTGKKIRSPNLTPDKETGIGNFSKDDFRKAIMEGITPTGRHLSPPMPEFKELTDVQVDALYAYLKSIPPVHHEVKRR